MTENSTPVTENSGAIQLLQRAKTWLEAHDWCQGAFVLDAEGRACLWPYKNAARCCAVGALIVAYDSPKPPKAIVHGPQEATFKKAFTALTLAVEDRITVWNDSQGRTKAEVLAAYERAIDYLKPKEPVK